MMENQPKDYYHRLFQKEVSSLNGKRPSLFLHACCGPCLTYPLSLLCQYFDVTIGFFNPNIRPESEYHKRLDTMNQFLRDYGKDHNLSFAVVVNDDDFVRYDSLFQERWNDHEGGKTCLKCHAYRMNLAYHYAFEHHFDYFTTVMTVSCKKPSRELNEIAENLSLKYPSTKYLYSDFKKEDGQLKGILLSKEYSLYRQDYCGCLPSLKERIDYFEKKKKDQESCLSSAK